jgi:NitT/TauT family transport system substrate-binding protein
MRKSKIIWLFTFTLLLLVAGFAYYLRPDERQIRISSNPWIGFTPFIYAQEKGWLDVTPFRFSWLVDLTENARLYEGGFTNGFTATQYELLHFKDYHHLAPVFLIDRSAGADAILANRSLEELRHYHGSITVYLELGSLNEDLFKAFVHENKLEHLSFSFKNSSPKEIAPVNLKGAPVVIISYAPYATDLNNRGFLTIASTRTLSSLFVIDALFVDEKIIAGREEDFQRLRNIFDLALKRLHDDPHEFYNVIRSYLEGQSFEEFMMTVPQIEWLNHGNLAPYLQQLKQQNITTHHLLP